MVNSIEKFLKEKYGINEKVVAAVNKAEEEIKEYTEKLDEIREYNQYKVISAMQTSYLGSSDFHWSTGYGYGDLGREKVEEIYAKVFGTEDALVRPTISSGTHALYLTLSGILRPNDELVYATGAPYDTLRQVIGTEGDEEGTLFDFGIRYNEVPLKDNKIDLENIKNIVKEDTKLVALQRSTGYSDRRAFTVNELKEAIDVIKSINKDIIIMVDNCYGEFLDIIEPTNVGADIMAGSLIKNPGGGLALAGGYIVGREDLVSMIANRLTAPGLGKDTGLTFGTTRTTLQGFFLAPHVTMEAVKGAMLVGRVYESLGFEIVPKLDDPRSDIIQAIKFNDPEKLGLFCEGIQSAATVDSFFTPEYAEMAGYEDKVIMAAGGFIEGSSIELSADGPMREPYYGYYQGGLTYDHCKLGVMISLNNLLKEDLIKL
ncbi:MAG TPA: methionine gamma-lyase family protein [Tissierellaceae bacterium]